MGYRRMTAAPPMVAYAQIRLWIDDFQNVDFDFLNVHFDQKKIGYILAFLHIEQRGGCHCIADGFPMLILALVC